MILLSLLFSSGDHTLSITLLSPFFSLKNNSSCFLPFFFLFSQGNWVAEFCPVRLLPVGCIAGGIVEPSLTHVVRKINTQYLHQSIKQASRACCFVLCIVHVLNNVLIHVLIFLHLKKENVYMFCKLISSVNFCNFFSLFKCLVKP